MDILEANIDNLEKYISGTKKDVSQTLQNTYHEALYNISQKSISYAGSIDKHVASVFPDIHNYKGDGIFSPQHVFELKEMKGVNYIDNYDKTVGLLADRKVVGSFSVTRANVYYCMRCKTDWSSFQNYGNNQYNTACQCTTGIITYNNNYNIQSANSTQINKKIILSNNSNDNWEVDNYLNLYQPKNQIYLMINKTSFPLIFFHFWNNIINCRNSTNQILSNSMSFCSYVSSSDLKSQEVIDMYIDICHTIIPKEYNLCLEMMTKLRKIFTDINPEQLVANTEVINENISDKKDRLITKMEERLRNNLEYQEKLSNILTIITEKYNEKSLEVVTISRDMASLKISTDNIIKDNNNKKLEELNKLKLELTNDKINTIEELNRKIVALQNQLIEMETYRYKCSELDSNFISSKDDIEKLKNELLRQKDINKGLTERIMNDNQKFDTLKKEYDFNMNVSVETSKLLQNAQYEIDNKSNIINKLNKDIQSLSEQLKVKCNNNGTSVEKSLYDRITELESNIKQKEAEIKKFQTENKVLNDKINGIHKKLYEISH